MNVPRNFPERVLWLKYRAGLILIYTAVLVRCMRVLQRTQSLLQDTQCGGNSKQYLCACGVCVRCVRAVCACGVCVRCVRVWHNAKSVARHAHATQNLRTTTSKWYNHYRDDVWLKYRAVWRLQCRAVFVRGVRVLQRTQSLLTITPT